MTPVLALKSTTARDARDQISSGLSGFGLSARSGAVAEDPRGTIRFMIDHIVLTAQNVDKSKAFYLKALGYGLGKEYPGGAGFGSDGRPSFGLAMRVPDVGPTGDEAPSTCGASSAAPPARAP